MPSGRGKSLKKANDDVEKSDEEVQDGDIIQPSYKALDVPIPDDFLVNDPLDALPIKVEVIDWAKTKLPEYDGYYAAVLDHVLSPSECETLLRMAEDSVADRGKSGTQAWRPALVHIGGGWETLDKGYRNSDRIIWDKQVIMDRLGARCAKADGIRERLAVVEEPATTARKLHGFEKDRCWEFSRFNERMRFLKYTSGQFFRPHCDGAYSEEKDGKFYQTHYTVHLYLNNSIAELPKGRDEAGSRSADLVGGATSFLSHDCVRKVDVNPKSGRVLIFQHKGLYHSGDDVVQGTKYTMRTDIMYELKLDSTS